jgi:hypothetical protein
MSVKTLRASLAFLLLAAAAACAHNTTRMSRNLVGGHPVGGDLSLTAEKKGDGDSASFELFVHWTSNFRVNVQPGPSLTIIADRQTMTFSANSKDIYHDSSCEQGPCLYDDRAYYPATAAEIRTIAQASRVMVELTGSKRTVQRDFTETNFDNFRDFVARHVPGPSAAR